MNLSLTDKQVEKLAGNKYKVVTYPDLIRYKSIDKLLGPNKGVILLYETRPNYGHYTVLFERDNDTIEFFDPYGLLLDHELSFIPDNFRKTSKQNATLSKLLLNSKYKTFIYNDNPFQKMKKGISTCGRWAAVRLLYRMLPIDDFKSLFLNKNSDKDIVSFTKNLF